ncbi:type II toxin-antitoxin system RelE/ParE family toxin [Duganella radicis]|uniref:Peptidase n=1 Tax=Duganella radicis TaxID=551988 RepID=A0A6L6PJ51_9BURK|nr:type II toxin-antitoxin system RelE/ParE family toxin [Duganella radicis]MTV39118.1 peptidase [Duganella radicis]
MIVSFRHKGLRKFYETGSLAGIQPHHAARLRFLLAALDIANTAEDMNKPGYDFHLLKGFASSRCAVSVNANWRLTFEFYHGNAYLIDYEDYH